jgi:cytochrome c-type protein NapC
MRHSAIGAAVLGTLIAATPAVAGVPDWGKVPARKIIVFYPGVASLEWVLNTADHSGATGIRKGESCVSCHEGEGNEMGRKIVSGEKAEPNPPKGKAPGIPVMVQAAHDGANLYLRFQWQPAAADSAAKPDPRNRAKVAVMIDDGKVEYAGLGGCWSSCHDDIQGMPDANPQAAQRQKLAKELGIEGPSKYLKEACAEIEFKNRPRGGLNKVKAEAAIAELLQQGKYLELLQYRSGAAPREGYVLEARHMKDAAGLAEGSLKDGLWTVTFKRKLAAADPGKHALIPGRQYSIGFAIHDEHAAARQHHVSFGYILGLDSPGAEINAVRQN